MGLLDYHHAHLALGVDVRHDCAHLVGGEVDAGAVPAREVDAVDLVRLVRVGVRVRVGVGVRGRGKGRDGDTVRVRVRGSVRVRVRVRVTVRARVRI